MHPDSFGKESSLVSAAFAGRLLGTAARAAASVEVRVWILFERTMNAATDCHLGASSGEHCRLVVVAIVMDCARPRNINPGRPGQARGGHCLHAAHWTAGAC